jgi:hypothetical protein
MKKVAMLFAALAAYAVVPNAARAENGQIAAGVLGGLAAGTLLGSAIARPPYAPAPVYVAPPPPVVYEAPACYWTRGAPVWDDWRGIWVPPRVQVCD